mmetsp:Transcript_34361/g.77938  ORF Transcript_34361/g.77938 Transcript_34361/m.77938 type:complete len:301 (+) Transcript_34361:818-1720(+)
MGACLGSSKVHNTERPAKTPPQIPALISVQLPPQILGQIQSAAGLSPIEIAHCEGLQPAVPRPRHMPRGVRMPRHPPYMRATSTKQRDAMPNAPSLAVGVASLPSFVPSDPDSPSPLLPSVFLSPSSTPGSTSIRSCFAAGLLMGGLLTGEMPPVCSPSSSACFGWMQIDAKLPPACLRVKRPMLTANTPPSASLANGARSDGRSSMSGRAVINPLPKLAMGSTASGAFSSAGTGRSGRNWRCCSKCDARRGSRSRGFGFEGSAGAVRASSWPPSSISTSSEQAATCTPPIMNPVGLGSR